MLKVVELINSLDKRGGAEIFFTSLCDELGKREDVELMVISLFDNFDDSFKNLDERFKNFACCHKKRKIDFKASKRLKKLIIEFSPDIINTHLSTITSYFLAFGFKKRKWKIVHTVHNVADKEATKVDRILRKPYISKRILSFIGISKNIAESIFVLHPNSDVKTIYNGIKFLTTKAEHKENIFICPARYSFEKNHPLLLKVFDKYCDKFSRDTLECYGFGEKINEYRELIKKLKNGSNIHLNEQVENIYPYLSKSKFLILSSLFEGNPISVLEALSLGIPCIVPRVGGIPDVIKHGVNGFLYNVNDENDMLSKMIEAREYNNYDEMSKRCTESVEEYSIEKTVSNYLNYFSEVLNS